MKYEFILTVKDHCTSCWQHVARSVVKEVDYNNAFNSFKKYQARGNYFDSLILINKLDDNGEFLEVVQ